MRSRRIKTSHPQYTKAYAAVPSTTPAIGNPTSSAGPHDTICSQIADGQVVGEAQCQSTGETTGVMGGLCFTTNEPKYADRAQMGAIVNGLVSQVAAAAAATLPFNSTAANIAAGICKGKGNTPIAMPNATPRATPLRCMTQSIGCWYR